MKKIARIVLGLWLVVGCEDKPNEGTKSSTSSTSASSTAPAPLPTASAPLLPPLPDAELPKLDTIPALKKIVVTEKGAKGLVVETRVLVPTLSVEDEARLLLRISIDDQAPATEADAWKKEPVKWAASFNALTLAIKDASGNERTLTAAGEAKDHPARGATFFTPHELHLGQKSLSEPGLKLNADWKEPTGPLFGEPGKYSLQVRGTAKRGAEEVSFRSAWADVEVKAADELIPLTEIERRALELLQRQKKTQVSLRPYKPTLEDDNGNRVVRYALNQGYDLDFSEIILDPKGEVLSFRTITVFTCIAEGTPIASPAGARPVEHLAVGDEVWAYDIEQERRVVTEITAIWPAPSRELVDLNGLRVTPHHPVYADGAWIEAGAVEPGARLIPFDGEPLAAEPQALSGGATVYQLSVGPPHTYFAGGLLVHNKATEAPGARELRSDIDYRPKPKK